MEWIWERTEGEEVETATIDNCFGKIFYTYILGKK